MMDTHQDAAHPWIHLHYLLDHIDAVAVGETVPAEHSVKRNCLKKGEPLSFRPGQKNLTLAIALEEIGK